MTRDADHLLPVGGAGHADRPGRHGRAELTADLPARTTRCSRAYGALVAAPRLNDQAYALVRQGRLAVYPSSHGQEACQVAAAQVLDDGDWLFPTYRDTAAIVARGVDPVEVLVLLKGDWHSRLRPLRAPRSRRRRPRWPPSCRTPSGSRTPPGCGASRPW